MRIAEGVADPRAVTTGLAGLDAILSGLRMGDNVVWRVDDLVDYRALVDRFVTAARADGRRVVYIRFGRSAPLVAADAATVHDLDAYRGFESFTVRLHTILAREGPGVFYVFDCLSELLDAWATDAMIGHFFLVTCPYLYELDTVAYFALLRPSHSRATVARIRRTTQVLVDVHRCDDERYVHPVKVDGRSSVTMFLPHRQVEDAFLPLTSSTEATALVARLREQRQVQQGGGHLDHWDLLFLRAAELAGPRAPAGGQAAAGPGDGAAARDRAAMIDQLCRAVISREPRMLALAGAHLDLGDLLAIRSRLIGTGYVGGKAVGMLVARRILLGDPASGRQWDEVLEPHDSWFVGSDVFYSYIVTNGWWRTLMEQKTPEGYFAAGARLREALLHGDFPRETLEAFQEMLEHFGQYPIIVRSSSLQEDGFGSAFAGKYDSVFLVSQGTPEERLRQFVDAVRGVYASTMSQEALAYRRARGLDGEEEQMALLVQRVSGRYHGQLFFPTLAGVAVSYNTFVWDRRLDPSAGLLRLVLGLGTRAVDRVAGDYPRLVALDRPTLGAFSGPGDLARFSQHQVDVLDVARNAPRSVGLQEVVDAVPDLPWSLVSSAVAAPAERSRPRGGAAGAPGALVAGRARRVLSFADLLATTDFPGLMRSMLGTLQQAYDYPVDVEFTADLDAAGSLRINLVQCRPMQTRGIQASRVEIPDKVPAARTLFRSTGSFMGGSIVAPLRRIICVDPQSYARLRQPDRHEVARTIGRLTRLVRQREHMPTALLGPGRWGTTSPSMGVPVRFAELGCITVLGEIAFSAGGLMPELSFGSHFFQDLVESGIWYVALFPDRPDTQLNLALLERSPNRLAELLPGDAGLAGTIRVVDLPEGQELVLQADIISQVVACHRPSPDG
jgi:hypothetical protein